MPAKQARGFKSFNFSPLVIGAICVGIGYMVYCQLPDVTPGSPKHKAAQPSSSATSGSRPFLLTPDLFNSVKPYTDGKNFTFPNEPPVPSSWTGSSTYSIPQEQLNQHLSTMDAQLLISQLGEKLTHTIAEVKEHGYDIPLSEKRELCTYLYEAQRRYLHQYSQNCCYSTWRDYGASGELLSVYAQLISYKDNGECEDPQDNQTKGIYDLVDGVNRKYADGTTGLKMVTVSEWRTATEAEKSEIAPFEQVWKDLEPASASISYSDSSTWNDPKLDTPKAAFHALTPAQQRDCRDYIMVRHRYNLKDLLDRWIWEAGNKDNQ